MAQALIRAAGRPIAAPSANRSGAVSPTRAEHVAESLGDRVKLILDGGPCEVGLESTVLDLTTAMPTLLRPGGATREAIEAVIGPVALSDAMPSGDAARKSPGQLASHYAPARPVRLNATSVAADEGLLAFGPQPPAGARQVLNLSPAATSPRRPPTCSLTCAPSTSRPTRASRSCLFRKPDWALRSTTGCAARPRMTAPVGGGRLALKERKRCPTH